MQGSAITIKRGKLQIPNDPIIPFIEWDNTGPDIWAAAVRVLDAAVEKTSKGKKKIVWKEVLAGEKSIYNQALHTTLSQVSPTTAFQFGKALFSSTHPFALDIMRVKQSILTTNLVESGLTEVSYTLELKFTAQGGADTNTTIYNCLTSEILPDFKAKFEKGNKVQNKKVSTYPKVRSWEEERERIEKIIKQGMILEVVEELRKYLKLKNLIPNFLKNTLLSIETEFNDVHRRYLRGELEYRNYRLEFVRICQLFIIEALNRVEVTFREE